MVTVEDVAVGVASLPRRGETVQEGREQKEEVGGMIGENQGNNKQEITSNIIPVSHVSTRCRAAVWTFKSRLIGLHLVRHQLLENSPLAVRLRRLKRSVAILTLCDGGFALGKVAVELDETVNMCVDSRASFQF